MTNAQRKKYLKKYRETEKYKKYQREWQRKYRQTKKYKDEKHKYDRSPKRKEYWKEYTKRPEVIARRKAYDQLLKNKTRRCAYMKTLRGKTAQLKWKESKKGRLYYKSYKMWWRKTLIGKSKNKVYNKSRRRFGKATIIILQQVYEDNIKKYGTLTCYLCLEPIQFGKDHLEHKTPLSRGGTNARKNLDVACQRCNCKKHNKTEKEFRKYASSNPSSIST